MKIKITFVVLAFLSFSCASDNAQRIRELELEVRYSSFRLGSKEKSIHLCDKLLKYIPNHPEANYEKAEILTKLGKYQEAIEPYNMAIKYHYLAKRSGLLNNAYYNRGQTFSQLGRLEEALESYDLAIKHGYNERTIYFLRNEILMALGRFPG